MYFKRWYSWHNCVINVLGAMAHVQLAQMRHWKRLEAMTLLVQLRHKDIESDGTVAKLLRHGILRLAQLAQLGHQCIGVDGTVEQLRHQCIGVDGTVGTIQISIQLPAIKLKQIS